MRIDVEKVTPRQKLTIAKGLCDYRYIMDNWRCNDGDFQAVYYEFYVKARWAVMSKPGNAEPYFQTLQRISGDESMMDVLDILRSSMEKHGYELSLGSKLLHTRNPQLPIYDSKVRTYLTREEGVAFWWYVPDASAPRGTSQREKIQHDWQVLCQWYDGFLGSPRGKHWVAWFDRNFPAYRDISDVKKVDFIIFAAGEADK